MESNSLGGGGGGGGGGKGMFPGMNPAMLGLELPLPTNPSNPHQLHHSSSMVSYVPQPQPSAVKYPFPVKPKPQQLNLSDDEEPSSQGFAGDDSNGGGGGDGKKKISPWQRMKWTDMMVRLLITAVFYIGDEGGTGTGTETADHKKKSLGFLQKKGKWKSVSRAMMEKGFYVSPQQCEDKFNDLNKRYKRVNDILGKGIACRVVENQSLLDSMELTPKIKEEVRKLLNSKHLFFREMCAYHNSCRHGGGGTHPSPDTAAEPPSHLPPPPQQQCFHERDTAAADDEEDDEEDESEEDDDDEEDQEETSRGQEDEEETESRKRARKGGNNNNTAAIEQLSAEAIGILQDGGRSAWEKKQWMKSRLIQLEEQQVSYQSQAFDLEKQRLKWMKFRSKKERDMERAKLENEKRRLENERMVLMVKQKELDLMEILHYQQQQQNSSNKRGDPSSITG